LSEDAYPAMLFGRVVGRRSCNGSILDKEANWQQTFPYCPFPVKWVYSNTVFDTALCIWKGKREGEV